MRRDSLSPDVPPSASAPPARDLARQHVAARMGDTGQRRHRSGGAGPALMTPSIGAARGGAAGGSLIPPQPGIVQTTRSSRGCGVSDTAAAPGIVRRR